MLRFLSLLFFFTFVFSLLAQTDSIADQQIDEVEITTIVKPSVFQSTNLIQVLTVADIDRVGIQSLSDAVRRFAGVSVKDYGGLGGLKTVSIRGLGAQHTAVSRDDITVGEAQSGQVDIGRFSLDNVSMISLSIGQSDNIFQSARYFASSGVLDIKTNRPSFLHNNYQTKLTVRTGSFGLLNPAISHSRKISTNWSASLNGSWERTDGTYPFHFDNGTNIEKRKRYNSDVAIWRTELNVYGNFKNSGTLKLKAYYFDSERGLPSPMIPNNQYTGERLWDKNFFTQANYENIINDKISIKGLAKFSRNFNKYTNISHNYGGATSGGKARQIDKYTQLEYYASGIVLYKPSKILSFSFAQDYVRNNLDMRFAIKRTSNNESIEPSSSYYANRNTYLSAFNSQLKTNRLTVSGGLLATFINEDQNKGNVPDNLKRFSPSLSISYKPFDSELRFRASYKDIFRVPSFSDVYFTNMGIRSLRPEKAKQHNLGVVWMSDAGSFFDYLSISVDGYVNKVKDKIVLFGESAYNMSMVNMGRVTIKGIDVTLASEIGVFSKVDLLFNAAYSYQDAKDDDTKQRPSYTPKHSGNLSFTVQNPWINFTYSFVASDKRYGKPITSYVYRLESFFDHSISANKTIKWNKYQELRLQGELLNLANKNYEIIRSYPMPGRSFRFSAGWIF